MTLLHSDTVTLRPLQPDDQDLMSRLFFRLSPETIYRRFMTYYSDPAPLRSLLDVDGDTRAALVAVDSSGEIVGVARYARAAADRSMAEVAVLVQDDAQANGIGQRLLAGLAERARTAGIRTFTGTMLASNDRCARLFERVFPDVQFIRTDGEVTLLTPL